MKKKVSMILGVIAVIITIFIALDSFMEWGIYNSIMVSLDSEGPIIETSGLPNSIQLDSDFELVVTCTDNVDDVCEVEVIGVVDTSRLGSQSVTLQAVDTAGNITSYVYNYEIIEGVDTMKYAPSGYYDSINGLTGEDLKNELNNIITNHTEFPYTSSTRTDVWDILREADEDPDNPDNVILFYTGFSLPKDCQQGSIPEGQSCELTIDDSSGNYDPVDDYDWNREHIWSKSRGDFEEEDGYEFEDSYGGLALGAHTDGHHLVAAERAMNSTKNNRFFEDCHDGDGDDSDLVDRGFGNYTCSLRSFEPRDEVKGDVARMIFYMAVRYEGEDGDYVDLEVINDPIQDQGSKLPVYGDVDDLLRWHIEDPVDEREVERNEVVYTYQGNRNPFIEKPELVALIWGESSDYDSPDSDRTYNLPVSLSVATKPEWVILNNISYLPERKEI